jgi:hypothetical protein
LGGSVRRDRRCGCRVGARRGCRRAVPCFVPGTTTPPRSSGSWGGSRCTEWRCVPVIRLSSGCSAVATGRAEAGGDEAGIRPRRRPR